MRVITGSARGTKLQAPAGESTRPTTDRVKEAIFSMIQFDIEGRSVLDLFAGSGQMAIEALSRGAAKATLIDSSREVVNLIIENAKKTRLFDKCRISCADYSSFIRGAAGREKYDLVFLDPPYASGYIPKAIRGLADGGMLALGSHIICETENTIPPRAKSMRKDEGVAMTHILSDIFGGDEELMSRFDILKSSLYSHTRITILSPKSE